MTKSNVALACALGIVVMLPATADETTVKLDASMGLWEVTTHPRLSGKLQIPEEQLQKMTPEQRARVEAAMQGVTQSASQDHVIRECLTPEMRSKGFDLGNEGSSCKTTVIQNSSSELQVRRACNENSNVRTTTEHFRMSGSRHMSGTVDAAMAQDGRPVTMHMVIEGRWLSANCGDVKDAQVVK